MFIGSVLLAVNRCLNLNQPRNVGLATASLLYNLTLCVHYLTL